MHRQRSIFFIANERDFLFRHFAPIISAAQASGLKVTAALPEEQLSGADRIGSVRVYGAPLGREVSLGQILRCSRFLVARFRAEPPDIAMAFSVRVALALAFALPFIKIQKVFVYVTGLGLLQLLEDKRSAVLRRIVYGILRLMSRLHPCCYFIFENRSDPKSLGFGPHEPALQVNLMGAGVDVETFVPHPLPARTPLRLAIVSRLIWSKGIDLGIKAVSELVTEGLDLTLDIYGAPDLLNPLAIDPAAFSNTAGVRFMGHTSDIVGVWAEHHAALFPTRGGEGTPRSLLEASACGRASIVTNVDGCSEFIRNGVEGFVVEPDSVASLKLAIRQLYDKPDLVAAFGQSARQRVVDVCSSTVVENAFKPLFS
ncbi:glycosyltransferase [Rhodopseudomonas palustris]|nr:glycosyltransferase [Rhodopseudomonas palustris]